MGEGNIPGRSARELVSQRALALANRLGPAVRPLVGFVNNRYSLVGSCVLVEFGGVKFLLSAAHVLDDASVLLLAGPSGWIRLNGDLIRSDPPVGKRRDEDLADTGIIRLSKATQEELRGVVTLSAEDLDVNDDGVDTPPTKHYIVIGYPSSKARFSRPERRARFEGFVLTATVASSEAYRRTAVTDDSHVLLHFDSKDARTLDGRATAPRLSGVSGGGVWRLNDPFDLDASHAALAAVAMEHRKLDKVLIGTRVSLFCEILRRHYPELADRIPTARRIRLVAAPPNKQSQPASGAVESGDSGEY